MPEITKPGGLSYEVVLEDAKVTSISNTIDMLISERWVWHNQTFKQKAELPSIKCPATPTPSVKDIEKKLKVA